MLGIAVRKVRRPHKIVAEGVLRVPIDAAMDEEREELVLLRAVVNEMDECIVVEIESLLVLWDIVL